jgi:RNA polymerase sigma-70 factor (ECF subfamily)
VALTDTELIELAQGGDVTAVGRLYDAHHQSIFRYVWSRVSDQQLAEDLTGEIFTRMVTKLNGYQPSSVPFRAWLYRIARNLVIDHHRSENGRVPTSLEAAANVPNSSDNPVSLVEQILALENILAALTRIDPEQQEVINLRFVAGLSLAETAQTIEKSVPAVKSLQHRGLQALRATLKQV